MKKRVLIAIASAFATATSFTSCNSPAQKVENAQEKVNEANENLDKANEEYQADIERCRRESAQRFEANDRTIAELKAEMRSDKKAAKAEYRRKVEELEQRNNDLRVRMNDYKADGRDNWERFKIEFNHDMDDLGRSFRDLTTTNS